MVRPGVTTRKPRVNRPLPGWRTALTVCQAISIAITVVLPAPVASLSASRARPGLACSFASCSRSMNPRPSRPAPAATSVSQITVSTASTWQKNGRRSLNWWWRQCWSRRAVSGVTRHWARGSRRHSFTLLRTLSIILISSYCWPSSPAAVRASSRPSSDSGVRAACGRRESA